MKVHQLSLFVENKPGALLRAARALADAGISMLTLCLADTTEFGILRIIVKDWHRGMEVLQKAGCVVNVTEVLAIDVADRPGGLAYVLDFLEKENLEIEYIYAFTGGPNGKRAAIIFRFEDPDAAIKVLERHGINIIAPVDLFGRVEA